MTLALLLERAGIESVVLEAPTAGYVEQRVRAGLLEQNTVELLRELGVAERLDREGLVHDGIHLRRPGDTQQDRHRRADRRAITIYGQQEVVKDLIAARLERGGAALRGVRRRAHDLDSERPAIRYARRARRPASCGAISSPDATAFTASRGSPIAGGRSVEYERVYPFSWLGILAEARPPPTS